MSGEPTPERMVESLVRAKWVAKRLGAGVSTVYRLAERGVLPAVRIPGIGLRFRPERVEEWLRTVERNGRGRRGRRQPPVALDEAGQ